MEVFSGILIPEPTSTPYPGKLVVEEGKIAALLPTTTSRRENDVYIVPGFIDSHTHPLETGLGLLFPDLSSALAIADCLELLVAGLTKMADSPVLLAFNFDPDRIKEHRYLYRRELDRITRDKPVFVYRTDGHSAVANSKALEFLEQPPTLSAKNQETRTIEGLELDGAGKPTGVLRAQAYETLSLTLKTLLPDDLIKEAINLTGQTAVRKGVTTLAACIGWDGLKSENWAILYDALNSTLVRMEPFFQTWDIKIPKGFGLKRVGGCLLLDGSFGSHTAALNNDYTDALGYKGVLYQTDQRLISFIQEATEAGLQTAFHAIGDRAVEQLIRCHKAVRALMISNSKRQVFNELRHRIEHAELLSEESIAEIAELGLVICAQPAFETAWGGEKGMYAQRLGRRWRQTNPLRTLFEHHIIVAGGSDSPITPIDPLAGIRSALSLPNETARLTGEQAFALFTTNAAYSLHREEKTGQLKPGLDADFVVLTADPRTGSECQIVSVYRQGKLIYGTELAKVNT